MRRALNGGQPLHRPGIRKAEGSYPAIRPTLDCRPFDRVVAVSPFVLVGAKISIRLIPATNILNDDSIAPLHSMLESCVLPLSGLLPVGGAIHQHGKFALFS